MYWLKSRSTRLSPAHQTPYWQSNTGVLGLLEACMQAVDELTEKYGLPDWIKARGLKSGQPLGRLADSQQLIGQTNMSMKILPQTPVTITWREYNEARNQSAS